MQISEKDKPLIFISLGIVFFSFLAIVTLLVNLVIIFYLCIFIVIALGFYLTYNLSREKPQDQNKQKR